MADLIEACRTGDVERVKILIQNDADINLKTWGFKLTPLHYACDSGHKEIVELLLQNGADINAKDTFNMSPLQVACIRGYKKIVELLLSFSTLFICDFDINEIDDPSIRDLIREYTSMSLIKGAE
jgi:ankyrin repeat protein